MDDPVMQIDLTVNQHHTHGLYLVLTIPQEHTLTFLKECTARNISNFNSLVDQLSAEEMIVVRQAVTS
jgi:hypothetical protein